MFYNRIKNIGREPFLVKNAVRLKDKLPGSWKSPITGH